MLDGGSILGDSLGSVNVLQRRNIAATPVPRLISRLRVAALLRPDTPYHPPVRRHPKLS